MKRFIATALIALLAAFVYAVACDVAAAHPRKPRHHYVANGRQGDFVLLCPAQDGWVYAVRFRCQP